MNVIAKVFAEQWIYMVLAVVLVALTFLVKKKKPEIYDQYLKGALVIITVVMILLAVLFKQSDLFLLVPIVMICCELFGYSITGRVVAVLFVDFVLIQILYAMANNNVINVNVMNVIFIVLQVLTAVGVGFVMDKHLRTLQAQKKKNAGAETILENNESETTDEMSKISENTDYDSTQSVSDAVDNIAEQTKDDAESASDNDFFEHYADNKYSDHSADDIKEQAQKIMDRLDQNDTSEDNKPE